MDAVMDAHRLGSQRVEGSLTWEVQENGSVHSLLGHRYMNHVHLVRKMWEESRQRAERAERHGRDAQRDSRDVQPRRVGGENDSVRMIRIY